jgi:hypothetical protein
MRSVIVWDDEYRFGTGKRPGYAGPLALGRTVEG